MMYKQYLNEFLQLTENLLVQLNHIQIDMKKNEPGEVEKILHLVEQREEVIKQLDPHIKQEGFSWSDEDKQIIEKIREYQEELEPKMLDIYQSFSIQLSKLKQRKQMTNKYVGAYQVSTTNGSFIDKRK